MEVIASLAPMPGALAGEESVVGGVVTGPWLSANSDLALLYRFTPHLLEVRALAAPALEIPEALATLNTAQLHGDTVEDLAISLVNPVTLNATTFLLIYVRDTLSQTARLYAFNPYTLALYTVSAEMPHNICSFSVSAPICAGGGSSTEWEFSIACFGLPGGKLLLGNLTVGTDSAQLTALARHRTHAHKSDIVSSYVLVMPGGSGRAIVFLCTASGQVLVLEYNPYGAHQVLSVGTIPEESKLGGAACVTAAALNEDSCIISVGYNASAHWGTSAAVATHEVTIKRNKRPDQPMVTAFKGLVRLEGSLSDNGEDPAERTPALLVGAKIASLAIYDMRHEARPPCAPPALVVVALASAGASSYRPSGVVFGFLNSWVFEKGASQLSPMTSQCAAVPGAVFGMHLSSKSTLIEVVTDKNVLVGDVLAGPTSGADLNCHHGIGMPLDIGAYTGASSDFAYSTPVRTALVEQRRRMDGELFIDLLLRMAGISGTKSSSAYPPRTSAALQALIERVGSSDLDDLKRHCLAYYMILDQSAGALVSAHGLYTECNTDLAAASIDAAKYACDRLVPRHFEYLMRGYWLMDHGQTAASISYFADPSVIADWAPKILRTAVAAGAYHEAAQLLNSATALMQPRLDEQPSEAPVVMEVLLHCSFARAFTFQRQRASTTPELRRALLAQMYAFALSAHSRRSVADQLASLPLDGIEEAALEEHCFGPDVPVYAKDFLALHYVNRGRYAEAIRLFKSIASTEEGLHLSDAQKRKRDERSAMVQNLTMLLPAAQKWLVQELESSSDAVDKATGEPAIHDFGRSRTMDVDNAPPFGHVDDEIVAHTRAGPPGISLAAQLVAPLSASKSARLLKPVVGMHGALQSSSHPLLRVLVKQMSAASAVTSQLAAPIRMGDARTTPVSVQSRQKELPTSEKVTAEPTTPVTMVPDRNLPGDISARAVTSSPALISATQTPRPVISTPIRMPFSGPPSTPRHAHAQGQHEETPSRPNHLTNAGQTPGRSVFAVPVVTETPQIAKRVPGSFPLPAGVSRSPFEMATLKSIAKTSESTAAKDVREMSPARPKPLRKTRGDAEANTEASIQRYNLRHRSGLPADGQTSENHQDIGEVDAANAAVALARSKPGASDLKMAQSTLGPKARPRTKQPKAAAALDELATSSKRSATNYERSVRSSDNVVSKPTSRTRKRE
ncbi:hypothetical protein GGI19_000552 [Coemansia pectinata]|uniref:ELYS-like domain-containing protein n=1 Tax=Coemansia pectinata TaxID=1052879 RepID=A0A9W8H622_9FUNG|nr:hypothetical protein GGI19_000552 [Coemansia pectinata]